MTKERFRQLVKRFHPDANGGAFSHGAKCAWGNIVAQRERHKNRLPRCSCGVVINPGSRHCGICSRNNRRNRLALAACILFISLTAFASTNTPPPVPSAPATTNVTPVSPTFRVPLVWTYVLNPSNDIPNTTVVQFRTNTASVFSLNQPAYVGTNRLTLNLPAGDWRIDVYGETGSAISASATIFGTAADGIEVVVSDFAKTTNRVVYSGPPMPGTNGYIRAWNTHRFTQTK